MTPTTSTSAPAPAPVGHRAEAPITPDREPFDRITRLVSKVLEVPVAAISFIRDDGIEVFAREGIDVERVDLRSSFSHLVLETGGVVTVRDTRLDARLRDHPLVAGPPGLRFWAAAPLRDENGVIIGTLDVADLRPRTLDAAALEVLADFATQAGERLEVQRLIAERERGARALAERDIILESAAFAAERLLRAEHWEDAVEEVLARLGRAARADRAYVFEKHEDSDGTPVISQRHEWVAAGVEPQIGNPELQGVPYRRTGLMRWEEVLSDHRIIWGWVSELSEDERSLLEPQGITTIVVVPIFTHSRWWGFVGFDDCGAGRHWTESEVEALRVAAGTLGAAIERREYEEALVGARDVAEEASRLKSALLTNMSHEIRTPLNGILGLGQLMADDLEGEPRDHMEMILDSGNRLLDTLNAILELTRLQTGSYTLHPQWADPVEHIRPVVDRLASRAAKQGVELALHVEESVPVRRIDPHALTRVTENLVANALKFTEAGRVEVRVRSCAVALSVEVRDTGIGIDPAFLPHVFDEFRQASTGSTRTHEGSGIGLSIAHHLVELMGGRIDVESRLGEGSVFTVEIPIASDS